MKFLQHLGIEWVARLIHQRGQAVPERVRDLVQGIQVRVELALEIPRYPRLIAADAFGECLLPHAGGLHPHLDARPHLLIQRRHAIQNKR